MLPNLCLVDRDGGTDDWKVSLMLELEVLSLLDEASCKLAGVSSILSSTEDTGVGTKNLGFPFTAGLIEGTEGDWNKLGWFPPLWLKVSTYLPKRKPKGNFHV